MKRIIIALAVAVTCLTSCDDMLNKYPKSELTPETYFRNETDLMLFSNPLYNNLLDKNVWGHQSDQYLQSNLSSLLQGGTSRQVPVSGGGWSWSNLRRINILLGNINNCSDEKVRNKYIGVGKFFRAKFYFDMVKTFGDVPWIDKELGSSDAQLYAPRDNREVVLTHMLEDIDEAIEYLPKDVTPYRLNRWSALMLKADFCLFEGTFRKYHQGRMTFEGNSAEYYLDLAAKAAEEVMNSGLYSLYSTGKPEEDYVNLFAKEDANVQEYILARKYSSTVQVFHDATGYIFMASHGKPGMNKKIVDSYLMRDGSRFTDKEGWQTMQFAAEVEGRDPRLAQTIRTPGYKMINSRVKTSVDFSTTVTGYQPVKFAMSADNEKAFQNNQSTNDLPIYRYAEALLIFAEAKAELGTLTQTDLDNSINLLRKRVGMKDMVLTTCNSNPDVNYLLNPEYGYSHISGDNAGVIAEIRRERTVELAQEGNRRWDDLLRWREGMCNAQPIYGQYFPHLGAFDIDGDDVYDIYLYDDTMDPKKSGVDKEKWVKVGTDNYLSNGTSGYLEPFQNITRSFNEERDYFYPIPIGERTKNHNLTQNPGWDDNLDF